MLSSYPLQKPIQDGSDSHSKYNRIEVASSLTMRFCRYDTNQCQTNTSIGNGILEILFSVEYPPDCYSIFCQEKFVEQVKTHVSQANDVMDLSLTTTDGEALNTSMNLCSFNQTKPGMLMLIRR